MRQSDPKVSPGAGHLPGHDTIRTEVVVGYLACWVGDEQAAARRAVGMGKDQRRLYLCPQCHGAQVTMEWKRASLNGHSEVQEIRTTENCPTCDGSGQLLGPAT
jgi:hypothetical protein